MKVLSRAFTPTKNRRLNELAGFLLFVCAATLFLALASYSPLDPSLDTAGPLSSDSTRNWIGLFGAMLSDLLLQSVGIAVFLMPLMIGLLGARWFRSREIASPGAKAIGASVLLIFAPAMLDLLPWHLRWKHAVAIEGLLGRLVGDLLLRYFNVVGAYIVCAAVIAIAIYLSTTFSVAAAQVWFVTRFAFAVALWQRLQDWRTARAERKEQKKLDRRSGVDRRTAPAPLQSQLVPVRPAQPAPQSKNGMERVAMEADADPDAAGPQDAAALGTPHAEPAIGARADSERKGKTVMPKIANGGYKLPPTSLLHRAESQQTVNEEEVKVLAEV